MTRGTPRPKIRLTKRVIDDLFSDDPRGVRYYDSEIKGFGIVVYSTGTKSFFVDYGPKHRQKRMVLGRYGVVTLEQARKEALKVLGSVVQGDDPLAEKKEAQVEAATTFGLWVDEYLTSLEGRKKTVREDRRYLNRAVKRWGAKPLNDITAEDVSRLFEAERQRGSTTANRALASVRACLQAAWRLDKVEENVAARVRLLPENEPRSRVLSEEELARLMAAVAAIPDPFEQAAFRLLIETGCRLSEALRMRWEDLDLADLDNAAWRLPRPKSGRPEVKPLTRAVAEMLSALPHRSVYVIPGRILNQPRHDLKKPWDSLRKAAGIEGVRLHDLRRSFGYQVAKSAGIHMASKLLGHADVRVTSRIYAPLGLVELREAAEKARKEREAKILPFKKTEDESK